MDTKIINERVEYAKEFAKGAGEILLKRFRNNDLIIENKGTIDLVTDADKKSEAYIIGSIFNKFPEDSILAEESGDIEVKDSSFRWIIDPLDGTTNFAHGFYLFSISIALECDGEIVGGVVYIPYLREMFHAIKDCGAFLNDELIHVSDKTELINSVIATGFPYSKSEDDDNNLKEHNKMILVCQDIRRTGSAAIDLSYTAMGIWDGYWEKKLNPWDISAGALIVKEAGGSIYSILGKEFNYMEGNIACGNKIISKLIVDVINN